MEKEDDNNKTKDVRMVEVEPLNGFSPVSSTRIFWKSRKRSASGRNLDKVTEDNVNETPNKQEESSNDEKMQDQNLTPELSERRKALFEPLEPATNINGKRSSAESLLPPPDFDAASYPKGWLIGKKRKLVNVDVVESMRRIAVQEMNRKDREIDGLNEQLEEDARCLEHLQLQLMNIHAVLSKYLLGGHVTVSVEMVAPCARLLLFVVVSPSYLVNAYRPLVICSCVDASWLTIFRSIMWLAILLPFCCARISDLSFAGYFDSKSCPTHFGMRSVWFHVAYFYLLVSSKWHAATIAAIKDVFSK